MQVILDTNTVTEPAKKVASHLKYSMKSLKEGIVDAKNKIVDTCAPAVEAVKTYGLGVGTKAETHFCPNCGISVEEFGRINYCPQCGRKI